MRHAIVVLVGLPVALAIAGWTIRDTLYFALLAQRLTPKTAFDDLVRAPSDYASTEAWASFPSLDDGSDFTPNGLPQPPENRGAAVFFVHPTTYLSAERWNAPITDQSSNQFTDLRVLLAQASVFNSCCEIHAPRYRQAMLGAFLQENSDAEKAIELALEDIEDAFDAFLSRIAPDSPSYWPIIAKVHGIP